MCGRRFPPRANPCDLGFLWVAVSILKPDSVLDVFGFGPMLFSSRSMAPVSLVSSCARRQWPLAHLTLGFSPIADTRSRHCRSSISTRAPGPSPIESARVHSASALCFPACLSCTRSGVSSQPALVGFCFPCSLTVTSGSSIRARFFLCFGWIFAGARPSIHLESPVQKTRVFLV
jgi:hypothetical protein